MKEGFRRLTESPIYFLIKQGKKHTNFLLYFVSFSEFRIFIPTNQLTKTVFIALQTKI